MVEPGAIRIRSPFSIQSPLAQADRVIEQRFAADKFDSDCRIGTKKAPDDAGAFYFAQTVLQYFATTGLANL
jgi:hypothetical protein